MNEEGLRRWAPDLRNEVPRSPRDKVGGFVILGRCVDKCRAALLGIHGDYNYWPCALCAELETFSGIHHDDLQACVAEGGSDEEVGAWFRERSGKSAEEITAWNWQMQDKRMSDLPVDLQVHLEEYVAEYLPPGRPIYAWFDLYDIEEGRL
jgi:hypothetical protein